MTKIFNKFTFFFNNGDRDNGGDGGRSGGGGDGRGDGGGGDGGGGDGGGCDGSGGGGVGAFKTGFGVVVVEVLVADVFCLLFSGLDLTSRGDPGTNKPLPEARLLGF